MSIVFFSQKGLENAWKSLWVLILYSWFCFVVVVGQPVPYAIRVCKQIHGKKGRSTLGLPMGSHGLVGSSYLKTIRICSCEFQFGGVPKFVQNRCEFQFERLRAHWNLHPYMRGSRSCEVDLLRAPSMKFDNLAVSVESLSNLSNDMRL